MNPPSTLVQNLLTYGTIVWVLLDLALAAAAFYRFRLTPSGWLLGLGWALTALNTVALRLLQMIERPLLQGTPNWMLSSGIFNLVDLALSLAIIVGLFLIPRSLRSL